MKTKENKKNKEENITEINKNSKTIIIFLSILVLVLVGVILAIIYQSQLSDFYDKISGKVFTYQGMTFTKSYIGNIPVYSTELAIQGKDSQIRYFTLHLLNDPRKINNQREITERIKTKVYVSFTNSTLDCPGTSLTGYKLGEFTTALGATAKGTLTDYSRAVQDLNESGNYTEEMILERVKTCNDSIDSSVIIVDSGYDETKIFNDFSAGKDSSCYIIQAKDCETTKAAEMLILDLIYVMQANKIEETNQGDMPKDTNIKDLSEMLNVSEEEIITG